jgi:hypothetical protein
MSVSGSHRKLPTLERVRTQLNASVPLRSLLSQTWLRLIFAICCLALAAKFCNVAGSDGDRPGVGGRRLLTAAVSDPILVSYSYFEKDAIQNSNMQYFMATGMGLSKGFPTPHNTHFVVVVSGGICKPCTPLLKALSEDRRVEEMPDFTHIYGSEELYVLYRRENKGMDFAAHNVRSQFRCIPSVGEKYYCSDHCTMLLA